MVAMQLLLKPSVHKNSWVAMQLLLQHYIHKNSWVAMRVLLQRHVHKKARFPYSYYCSIFYCNKPHTYTYSCTNQVHIQRCTSFNIVRHPQASPCKIKSAGSPFQVSAAVDSQLSLNMSNVLK